MGAQSSKAAVIEDIPYDYRSVVVIGAGITGATTAYELVCAGRNVTLVDDGEEAGSGATAVRSGLRELLPRDPLMFGRRSLLTAVCSRGIVSGWKSAPVSSHFSPTFLKWWQMWCMVTDKQRTFDRTRRLARLSIASDGILREYVSAGVIPPAVAGIHGHAPVDPPKQSSSFFGRKAQAPVVIDASSDVPYGGCVHYFTRYDRAMRALLLQEFARPVEAEGVPSPIPLDISSAVYGDNLLSRLLSSGAGVRAGYTTSADAVGAPAAAARLLVAAVAAKGGTVVRGRAALAHGEAVTTSVPPAGADATVVTRRTLRVTVSGPDGSESATLSPDAVVVCAGAASPALLQSVAPPGAVVPLLAARGWAVDAPTIPPADVRQARAAATIDGIHAELVPRHPSDPLTTPERAREGVTRLYASRAAWSKSLDAAYVHRWFVGQQLLGAPDAPARVDATSGGGGLKGSGDEAIARWGWQHLLRYARNVLGADPRLWIPADVLASVPTAADAFVSRAYRVAVAPDSLPVVGPVAPMAVRGLYVNTAHGFSAFATAPATARLVRDLMAQEAKPCVNPAPLSPQRHLVWPAPKPAVPFPTGIYYLY